MGISSVLTNDQLAILGCFAAIAVCGLVAAISFRLGPAGQQEKKTRNVLPLHSARPTETAKSQERRAA